MASAAEVLPDDTLATGELSLRRCRTCGEEYPSDYVVCPRDSTPLGLDRDAEDPLLGVVLAGTYRVVRNLGRGGMGRLYEAQHTRLDRRFAIKVLHDAQSRNADARRRFEREARVLSRIQSDGVLSVVDVLRTPDGRAALVTSRLEGEDLKARLDRVGKLPVAEAIPIARQVCRGLAAAHAEGVVHRDLKPSNLFLESGADGRVTVKILDFGVAKLEGEPELTKTGAVVGTPAYMAPEQARGSAHVDARADLYAVGAVLYRMLTGKAPYSGDEPAQLLSSLLHEVPKRPRTHEPSIPIGLEALIQRAMARAPEDRPADALELERELAAFDEAGEPAPSATWEPSRGGDVSTLILPRGSVDRAQALARQAKRARPMAALLSLAAAAFAAGLTALVVVGLQTLDGDGRTAVEVSAAFLLTGAAGIGALSGLMRALSKRWASAPEVLRVDRVLARALWAGAAALGLLELTLRVPAVLEGTDAPAAGWPLVARAGVALAAAALAAWSSARGRG
ncbi:MAG TPA: serine/threonine-protein kinase [Sandaracinaceae bacterium LLY-WYZ-13_1]|nr:serine/threonine-protein kinase [Sandaracinaceae bacterium LLY-WYZ-13_1]